jgi:hypothetical protein
MTLSRPNNVMNHGRPPAGIAHLIVRLSGRIRSAARSSRLRSYVMCKARSSVSRFGALSSHVGNDTFIFAADSWNAPGPSREGKRAPSTTGVMETANDHVSRGPRSTWNTALPRLTRHGWLKEITVPRR